MNNKLEDYYTERFSMMSTQGWKQLIEDIQVLRDNYADIMSIRTADELNFRKGQLDILDWILSLKDISESTYENLDK